MGAFLALMGAILGAVISAATSATNVQQTNDANAQLAKENREDQQAYNTQAAANANAESRRQYWDLYSPQAKVNQLKQAGLSVGLMYGGGGIGGSGGTAAQAAPATQTAPVMQPWQMTINPMSEAIAALNETKQTESNVKKQSAESEGIMSLIQKQNQEIEQSKAQVKLIEAQTGGQEVTNTILASEKAIKDLQVKYEEATIDEKIQIVEQGLDKLKAECKVAQEQAYQMSVDSKYKEEMNDAILTTYKAQYWKLYEETILTQLQQETEKAKKWLVSNQAQLTASQKKWYDKEIERASNAKEIAEEELRNAQTQNEILEKENQYWWIRLTIDALKSVSNIGAAAVGKR